MGLTVAELEQEVVSQGAAQTGLLAEVTDARGTAGTLGARLDVALNPDGTPRTPVATVSFVPETAPIISYPTTGAYVALDGDLTYVYVAKRRLRINGALLPYVTSSTYDAGGDYTVVNFSTAVGNSITSVEYSFDPAAMPPLHYSGNPDIEQVVSGISTFATKHLSDAQYKSLLDDILARVTITSLASVDDGAGVDLVGRAFKYVDVIDDLRTLTPTDAPVYVQGRTVPGDGGRGIFVWSTADLSAEVTADTLSGIYVAPTSDPTGASGAWVRQLNGFVTPEMFGTTGGTSDEVQINAAIQATTNGDVVLAGSYNIDNSIVLKTGVNLIGNKTTTLNVTTPYIDMVTGTSISNVTIDGVTFVGSGDLVNLERLIYLTGCSDVKVEHCTFSESRIGIQFESCSRGKALNNNFFDIRRDSAGAQGYGILCNLDNNDIQASHNSFNNVERHCVYASSGSSNIIISNNIAIDSKGAPYQLNCSDDQNTMYNISIIDNIVSGIQSPPAGIDDIFGIITTGNINGLIIRGNHISDNEEGGGILCQKSFSASVNPLTNVIIDKNIISDVAGGNAISIVNADNVDITGNHLKGIDVVAGTYSGIVVAVSGTGGGSYSSNVKIEGNKVEGGKYSIILASVDATHKLSGITLGENDLRGATTTRYNMTDNVDYKTTAEIFRAHYYVNAPAAAQTEVAMTAGHGGSGYFIAPFTGSVYLMAGSSSGSIGAGSITFKFTRDLSVISTISSVIEAGTLFDVTKQKLQLCRVTAGQRLGVVYTTTADFTGNTRNYVAEFELVRD